MAMVITITGTFETWNVIPTILFKSSIVGAMKYFTKSPTVSRGLGITKEKPLPEGTYYYIIYVKDNEGKEVRFDGPLTIVK
jgi:hypothetical protein